ncbi:hypothetical protein EBU71_21395 [bacterium]|nr:hypothetical protein [Candidatus Elulimicrobium humile]
MLKLKTMKIIFMTTIFLTTIFNFAFGQINYDTVYTKTYGNSIFHTEGISLAEISNDSLMLSTGYYGGLNYCDWRPKLYVANIIGDTIWSKLSIPGNGPITRTFDGNFVNARGIKNTSNCSLDTILACKFNINGDTIWSKKYYFGVCNNQVKEIIQTADSGIAIICFFSYTSCSFPAYKSALIKLDVNGNTQWIKYFGSTGETYEGISIIETSSRELGIIFFTIDASGRGYTLIKTDPLGNTIWSKLIYFGNDVAGYCDIDILPNDNFLIVGTTSGGFIARVDTAGTTTLLQNYNISTIGSTFIQNVKYLPNHNSSCVATKSFTLIFLSMAFTLFFLRPKPLSK